MQTIMHMSNAISDNWLDRIAVVAANKLLTERANKLKRTGEHCPGVFGEGAMMGVAAAYSPSTLSTFTSVLGLRPRSVTVAVGRPATATLVSYRFDLHPMTFGTS